MKRLFNTIKWIVIAPVFLLLTYIAGIFSELFRSSVLLGVSEKLNLLCKELEGKGV